MRVQQKGYSLIEVLIAFAVMSLVLTAILPGQTRLLSRSAAEEERLLALDWATSHIEALGLVSPIRPGLYVKDWKAWHLELLVEADPANEGVYLIQALVLNGQNHILAEFETIGGVE